jgi:hypothetical protein
MTIDAAADPVATALDYPFARPEYSFLYDGGAVAALQGGTIAALDAALEARGAAPMAARTLVIAYGANAAPERLRRKYAGHAPDAVFPVLQARLSDFDIVFASHFSGYGALPATPAPSPGTTVAIAVTCLDAAQLSRMHETELSSQAYVFGRLDGIVLDVEGLGTIGAAHGYWSRHGAFVPNGTPLALAAISAEGRRFAEAEQRGAQTHARDRAAPGRELHDFIRENITDTELRAERGRALRDGARPFDHPRCEILVR